MKRFTHEDKTYLQFGLIQLWANPRFTGPENIWKDPPVLRPEVTDWLDEYGAVFKDFGDIGPPAFVFNSESLADAFAARFDPHRIRDFTHARTVLAEEKDLNGNPPRPLDEALIGRRFEFDPEVTFPDLHTLALIWQGAMNAAETRDPEGAMSGNPSKWPSVRGVWAVRDAIMQFLIVRRL